MKMSLVERCGHHLGRCGVRPEDLDGVAMDRLIIEIRRAISLGRDEIKTQIESKQAAILVLRIQQAALLTALEIA